MNVGSLSSHGLNMGAKSLLRFSSATDALGINVHFLRPGDGYPLATEHDMNLLRQAGFKRVRMDLLWSEVEKQPGVFDFRKYDAVINGLLTRGIRPMVILGLGNPIYSKDLTIQPLSVQQAFERYATEAAKRYKGLGLIYELVNEPNHEFFWKPKPNAYEYMNLALRVLPQIKTIDSTAKIVAPSTAGTPLDFLETCFQMGLLNWVDGVTIHPYQAFHKAPLVNHPPEQFEQEYREARKLVDKYTPPGKTIPLLLGEWGYSSAVGEVDEQTQANYMTRQSLLGMMYGVPVNIWYNWKGDILGGNHPKEKEHQFGIVDQNFRPKPAYNAMAELTRNLDGSQFIERLASQPNQYILRFSNGKNNVFAAWTSGFPQAINFNNRSLTLTEKPVFLHF